MRLLATIPVLLLTAELAGQNVHVKHDKAVDFTTPRSAAFRPGLIHGHHPRVDESALRKAVEERLLRQAAASGLKPAQRAEWTLTYSLSVREAVKRQRRGGRTDVKDVTEYRLIIRLVDSAGNEPWTTTATATVEDRRHKYVETHVLRAVTLSMAKYPPGAHGGNRVPGTDGGAPALR